MRDVTILLVALVASGCAGTPTAGPAEKRPEPSWAFKEPVVERQALPRETPPPPSGAAGANAPAQAHSGGAPANAPARALLNQRAPDYRQAMLGPVLPQTAASMNALLTEIDPDGLIFIPGSAMGDGGAVQVHAVWHDLKKSLKMDVLAAISMVWEKRAGGARLVDLYDPLGAHVAGSTLFRGRFVD